MRPVQIGKGRENRKNRGPQARFPPTVRFHWYRGRRPRSGEPQGVRPAAPREWAPAQRITPSRSQNALHAPACRRRQLPLSRRVRYCALFARRVVERRVLHLCHFPILRRVQGALLYGTAESRAVSRRATETEIAESTPPLVPPNAPPKRASSSKDQRLSPTRRPPKTSRKEDIRP